MVGVGGGLARRQAAALLTLRPTLLTCDRNRVLCMTRPVKAKRRFAGLPSRQGGQGLKLGDDDSGDDNGDDSNDFDNDNDDGDR